MATSAMGTFRKVNLEFIVVHHSSVEIFSNDVCEKPWGGALGQIFSFLSIENAFYYLGYL